MGQETAIVATDDLNEDPFNAKGSQTSESVVSETSDPAGSGDEGGEKKGSAPNKEPAKAKEPKTPKPGESPAVEAAKNDDGDQASPGNDDKKRTPKADPVQQRIDELTYHRREAERRESAAVAEAKGLRERLAALEKPKGESPAAGKAEGQTTTEEPPKPEDFQDMDDYLVAKATYAAKKELRQELAEKEAEQARKAQESEDARRKEETVKQDQDRNAKYWERLNTDKTKYSDFDEVVFGPDSPFNGPDVNKNLVDAIIDSEVPADLAYHFNSNPEEVARLSSLNPVQLGREIALIEARFIKPAGSTQEKQAAAPKRQSSAPEPLNPVKPSGGVKKRPEEMNTEEYREWRRNGGK